jgi:alkanesulfonate monooxygenase SsuD/methylene tetrahydromethanopterin reductase-like flavin-dependent oxidoreductase (luciferase family)
VLCAETKEEAEYLHASVKLLQRRIRQGSREPIASPDEALRELEQQNDAVYQQAMSPPSEWPRYWVGTPETVRRELSGMAGALGISELVIVTITHSHAARLRSYQLLAQAFDLAPPPQPVAHAAAIAN